MEDKKMYYKSKTWWGGKLTILAGAAQIFYGVDMDEWVITDLSMLVAGTIEMVCGWIVLIGRLRAKEGITFKKSEVTSNA